MSGASAWLLECADALTVAVADHEIVECIQPERFYPVPAAPPYCSTVVEWQGRLVPVMDMGQVFTATRAPTQSTFVCLLAYQEAPRSPLQYIGLPVNKTPQKVEVDDAQICEPDGSALLRAIALSCFTHLQQSVAIVDVARLCSGEFRELAQAS